MTDHEQELVLSDGREVLVDYVVESVGEAASGLSGPPEHYDPGSGAELYVKAATLIETGENVELSDVERERLEDIIRDNPDWFARDEEGPDDYRDFWDDE